MVMPLATLKDKSRKMGDYYSWWIAGYPKDGEQWGPTERVKGIKFSHGNRRDRDGKYRTGGGFYSLKFRTDTSSTPSTTFRGGYGRAYTGTYFCNKAWIYDFSYMEMYNDDADSIQAKAFSYGAQAMAKLRPDRPDFSPFVSLGELLAGLPDLKLDVWNFKKRYYDEIARIRRSHGRKIGTVARTHLALQFGWLPILADLRNWWDAYHDATKRAQQLVKDNGKWVRRRCNLTPLPSENYSNGWSSTFTTAYNGDMLPTHVTQCYSTNTAIGGGKAFTKNTYRISTRVWAVGKSKYWLPESMIRTPEGFNKLRRKLHSDLAVTPEHVFDLVPWSWLLDYFFEFGDFFAAISGGIADCLIWDYVYVMRSQEYDDRSVFTEYVYKTPTTCGPITCTVTRTGTLKSRVYGSIFGFGPTIGDLSPRQAGILGALGLSRL